MQQEKSTKVNFVAQLELLSERHGLKQKDFAEICGVSPAAVNKWFKGGDIKVEYAGAIARYFSMTIEQFAGLPEAVSKRNERTDSILRNAARKAEQRKGKVPDEENSRQFNEDVISEQNLFLLEENQELKTKAVAAKKGLFALRDRLDKILKEL
jgi:transcriptional regulator with XRE-family HTH domain